jgi:hypothetical protein
MMPPHIITQHIHEYHVNIPWIIVPIHEYHVDIPWVSMPLLGFHHVSMIAKKEVYDVLFYFKKGKNEGRRRDNDRFE